MEIAQNKEKGKTNVQEVNTKDLSIKNWTEEDTIKSKIEKPGGDESQAVSVSFPSLGQTPWEK